MNILVTGASGFLGNKLMARLVASGHTVTAIGRNPIQDIGNAVEFITADITQKADLLAVKEKPKSFDVIVHLAALVPKTATEDKPADMAEVNILGLVNLLEVFGPSLKGFVYASTAEVYGLPTVSKPIDEAILPAPLSYYGASKLAGELFCHVYSARNDLPVCALRFSVMYGEGDPIKRAVPNFINQALASKPLEVYGGEELRDYLHVDDAVEALILAAEKPISGVFNIGSGKGISIKATAQAIIDKINPSVALSILPRQKPAADIVLDITKAKQLLGYEPILFFPDKLDDQISWHKNNQ